MKTEHEKECGFCKKRFKHYDEYKRKYCSKQCSKNSMYQLNEPNLAKGPIAKGDIGELLVCADLLKKGYEVFRSVSSSCSCDLIVMKNKKIYRVEVKNRRLFKNGKIYGTTKNTKNAFDILVYVVDGGKIMYFPEIT